MNVKFSIKKINLVLIVICMQAQSVWADSTSILNKSNLPPEFNATYDIHKGSMRVGQMERYPEPPIRDIPRPRRIQIRSPS